MVHYEKGISSTYDNAYSPRWTYNMTNGGLDCGSYIEDAIHVREYQGALTMTASKGIDTSPIDEKLNRYIQQGLIDCKK